VTGWGDLGRAVEAAGLRVRGGFLCDGADAVPDCPDGQPARAVVLLGNAGAGLWERFAAAPEFGDGGAHPLDRWSRRVIEALAGELDAAALFPFEGPPYHPFQRWARRAEPLWPSPLGILIHPRYGLWHGYRGALAFSRPIDAMPSREELPSPCESCADKPCLEACPVGAFTQGRYEVRRCVNHIVSPAGEDCMALSCRARRACPVGKDFLYGAEQSRFHMSAFLASRRRGMAVGDE
jgi:ferredoxin